MHCARIECNSVFIVCTESNKNAFHTVRSILKAPERKTLKSRQIEAFCVALARVLCVNSNEPNNQSNGARKQTFLCSHCFDSLKTLGLFRIQLRYDRTISNDLCVYMPRVSLVLIRGNNKNNSLGWCTVLCVWFFFPWCFSSERALVQQFHMTFSSICVAQLLCWPQWSQY